MDKRLTQPMTREEAQEHIEKEYKLSELLKQKEVFISIPKKEQDEKLLKVLDEKGYTWTDGTKLTSKSHWKDHEELTVYHIWQNKTVSYGNYRWYIKVDTINFDDIDLEK